VKTGNIQEGVFEMKKILLVVGIVSIAVLAFGAVGYAYAQNQTPDFPFGLGMMGDYEGHGRGYGHGMMGGFSHGMMDGDGEYGPMHGSMVAALAEVLAISSDEIEARHDAGETMWEIAESGGLSAEEIQEVMSSTHDNALEDAVANGLMNEEQAEWMDDHMDQMWSGDYQDGAFGGHCDGGGMYNNSRWQGEN
jgi:hypothetical protein